MPASSSESLTHVEENLRASFADGSSLDHQVASSSKQILLHKIEFKPAEKPYSLQLDSLKSKYIHLNPGQSAAGLSRSNAANHKGTAMMGGKEVAEGLPAPKVVLYPEERVRLDWKRVQRVGAGLHNMGNTCFLNSTLQCLTYTAPLVNFCLSEEHTSVCKQQGFCMMCELQRHIRRCYDNNGHAIKPQAILQKLKMIAKHMHWGRQEDAHEFLRYLVDGLQKACLNGYTKLDKFSKETTVVNQIFGGFLRSQVQCLRCKERSNTYDPVLDISLDIKNVQSVERAFEKFVQPETLDNENAYMCPRCKQKVTAQKRLTIHKPPNVLTLQLKRFDINRMFGKISRHIQFQDKINLRPYMSNRQGEQVFYQLNAVLVHSGSACNMGHYYCYVRSPSQIWYCMNDAMVQQVNAGRVMNAEAYLLFYTKLKGPSNTTPSKLKSPIIGPQLPQKHHNHITVNGNPGIPSKDVGTVVPRKESKLVTPVIGQTEPKRRSLINPTAIPPPEKRSKVCFGIRPAVIKEAASGSAEPEHSTKPRIVMQIKHGKVTTFETSPNGKAKLMESDTKFKSSKLVPYGDDSESDNEVRNAKGSNFDRKVHGVSDNGKVASGNVNGSVIFDEKLNTTTSVPGNSNLLESAREKFGSNHQKTTPESNGLGLSTEDLKVQAKTQSPTRRSEPGALTCVTSPTSEKVNATTPWLVQTNDANLSPLLGSNSSASSVNSTTDWKIKDQVSAAVGKTEKEVQSCPGWTVTPETLRTKPDFGSSKGVSPKRLNFPEANPFSREVNFKAESKDLKSIENSSACSVPSHQETHKVTAGGDAPTKHRHTLSSPLHTESVEISEKQPLLNGFLDSDEEQSVRKKHKKAKKHKKHKHEHKEHEREYKKLSEESSDSHSKKKKKKKKHKRRHERDHSDDSDNRAKRRKSDQDTSEHEDSPEYEWVEKTVVTSQAKLDAAAPKDEKSKSVSHEEKKAGILMSEAAQDPLDGKKSGTLTAQKGANAGQQEKVHPDLLLKDGNDRERHKHAAVPVKQWDEGVTDSHRTNGHQTHVPQSVPLPSGGWDGMRSSSVVETLEKHSSSIGYGASVSSWTGERSVVDQAAEKDRQEKLRHSSPEDYDDEMDAGKTKKVKKHQSDMVVMGYGANPFQKHQDTMNKEKALLKPSNSSHLSSNGSSGVGSSRHQSAGSSGSLPGPSGATGSHSCASGSLHGSAGATGSRSWSSRSLHGASGVTGSHSWHTGSTSSSHSSHHHHGHHDNHQHHSVKHPWRC